MISLVFLSLHLEITAMIEALDIKREVELLSDRLGKTQDYL